MTDETSWTPDPTVGAYTSIRTLGPDDGATAEEFARQIKQLIDTSKKLVDAVSHDNNGSMVAGRYVGGNGGLYSTEAIKTADALRLELDRWK